MGRNKDEEPVDFEQAQKDHKNIEISRRRWEEDIDDPAIEHMRLIREEVEKDE